MEKESNNSVTSGNDMHKATYAEDQEILPRGKHINSFIKKLDHSRFLTALITGLISVLLAFCVTWMDDYFEKTRLRHNIASIFLTDISLVKTGIEKDYAFMLDFGKNTISLPDFFSMETYYANTANLIYLNNHTAEKIIELYNSIYIYATLRHHIEAHKNYLKLLEEDYNTVVDKIDPSIKLLELELS